METSLMWEIMTLLTLSIVTDQDALKREEVLNRVNMLKNAWWRIMPMNSFETFGDDY